MTDLTYASTMQIAQAIRNREVSSEEVVRAHIKRIEAVNPALNAVVLQTAEQAIDEAKAADKRLSRGENNSPLHGVPMTIKDSMDTAGVVTTGSTPGRVNYVPERDATVVARLKQAGAILLGKTNTSELTLSFETNSKVNRRTNNPYNLERSSGGSSGGAAAIIAAGGSPFDLGSDYGGSIRLPAHFCGIAGIKPTSGRVPRTGTIIPPYNGVTEAFQQIGPMARYVGDLFPLLQIIAGPDWSDPSIAPVPLHDPQAVDLSTLKIAYHVDNGITTPLPEVAEAVENAANTLADVGAVVEAATPPNLEVTFELFMALHRGAGVPNVRDLLVAYGTDPQESNLSSLLTESAATKLGVEDYSRAISRWQQFRRDMLQFMQAYDAIICPANARDAIPHGTLPDFYQGFSYTMTHNLSGLPGVVVRGGTSAEQLPIGVQVVGRYWREDVALAIAEHIENALGGWQAPPL